MNTIYELRKKHKAMFTDKGLHINFLILHFLNKLINGFQLLSFYLNNKIGQVIRLQRVWESQNLDFLPTFQELLTTKC